MPRTAKPADWSPLDVPAPSGRGAGSTPRRGDFVASGVKSALVEMPGRKASTVNIGLRKAVTASGVRVKVKMRGGRI